MILSLACSGADHDTSSVVALSKERIGGLNPSGAVGRDKVICVIYVQRFKYLLDWS